MLAAILALSLATPKPRFVPAPGATADNLEELVAYLHANAAQRDALKAVLDASSNVEPINSLSASQLFAMTSVKRFDYALASAEIWMRNMRRILEAMSALYAMLSPKQRKLLDEAADGPYSSAATVADAPQELPPPPEPSDGRLASVPPTWLVKPSSEVLERLTPRHAREVGFSGTAAITCTVDVGGYLSDCLVVREEPKDEGFGNAALQATGYMRMSPARTFGVPVEGQVTIPLRFQVVQPTSAAPPAAP